MVGLQLCFCPISPTSLYIQYQRKIHQMISLRIYLVHCMDLLSSWHPGHNEKIILKDPL